MDCGDLSDIQKSVPGKMNESCLKHIGKQVLEGLKFIHIDNQMHRDLKPLNLMMS